MASLPPIRTLVVAGLVVTIPPLAVSTAAVLSGLPAVLETGLCPGGPPDVAPYPCAARDYLARMIAGPWAALGHATVCGGWALLVGGVVLAWRGLRSLTRSGGGR